MPSDPQNASSERQETDQSLRKEREKTDDEIGRGRAAIEEVDAVIQRARGRADEVLEEARERADETLERQGSSGKQRRELRQERAHDDAVVRQERLTADEQTLDELDERKQALAKVLLLEREQTDERLLVERARGDAALVVRDDFLAMVSHDLRSLLGGIVLGAMQIKSATDDEAGQRNLKAAQRIQRFAAQMNRLVSDLVDVASIEGGRLAITPENQHVNDLIRDSLEAIQPMASTKGVSLNTTTANGSLVATCDRERILQVLGNLFSNAIKFTGKGGTVSVRVERLESEIRFCVTDTGVGIPSDQLEAIFERFWQVTKGDRRGLGLGLFISKCIVEAHGGRIWAESEVGVGSTFCFTLPGQS